VLLACDFFWPSVGGVELYVEDLGVRLQEAGCTVEVAARALPGRTAREHRGMRIHEFDEARIDPAGRAFSPELAAYRRLLAHGGYDAVVLLAQPASWVAAGLEGGAAGGPAMVLMPSVNAEDVEKWERQGTMPLVRERVRLADHVVAVTEAGLDAELIARFGRTPVFVPHAVTPDAAAAPAREALGLDPARPLLAMVANFWPVKNHLALLRTLAATPGDWQLVVAGHPIAEHAGYFAAVQAQAARDPRVRLVPGLPRADAAALIRDAELLLVPSRGESAGPLVALQAMALGTPWLATPECNAARDQAGGVVAALPGFPAAIARLLASPDSRAALAALGRAHWDACFTWQRTLPALLALVRGAPGAGDGGGALAMPPTLRAAQRALQLRVVGGGAGAGEGPMLSVVVPTYNRAPILRKCLAALAAQTVDPSRMEVLVCDDGSSDDTEAVVRAFAAPFALTYLRQQNSGPGAARNMGIRAARGELLLFLNDDALLAPDALAVHLERHAMHAGESVAVLGQFRFLPEHVATPFGLALERTTALFGYARMWSGCRYDFNHFYTCNVSVGRAAVEAVGLFDEAFTGPAAEDLDLGFRLARAGTELVYDARCVSWHDHRLTPHAFCRTHRVRGVGQVTLAVRQPGTKAIGPISTQLVGHWAGELGEAAGKAGQVIEALATLDTPASAAAPPAELERLADAAAPLVNFLALYFHRAGVLTSPRLGELLPAGA
jgi:GT2 family glycosyltransferase/glycosyltransferase involved in cell wall biosynthesis